MNDLTLDILTQDNKITSRDNKDQSISKVMKGRYDFERFLLDDLQSTKDEPIRKDVIVSDEVFTKDSKYSQPSKSEPVLATNEILYSSQNLNSIDKNISSEIVVKEIKLLLDNILKQEQSFSTGASQSKTTKLNRNHINNDIQTKLSYQNIQTFEEELRLVKSEKGYTLYINNQDSSLTVSKLIELLKIVKQEKQMDINKVVLNREIVLDEKVYIALDSKSKNTSDSKLNIKI